VSAAPSLSLRSCANHCLLLEGLERGSLHDMEASGEGAVHGHCGVEHSQAMPPGSQAQGSVVWTIRDVEFRLCCDTALVWNGTPCPL